MPETLPARRDDVAPISELGALAELAAEGFNGVVGRAEELHRAVARRSFGPTGAASAGPRAIHDAIAGSVYAGLRGGATALGRAAARSVRAAGGGPAITRDRRVRLVQGALNGIVGDRLERAGNDLRVRMAVRDHGEDVELTPEGLAAAFPDATPRPVVFVHGLCESEESWGLRGAERGTYFGRVLPGVGGTPVVIRYNTGLRISENGRGLASLLERLVHHWPVPVEELLLVGHSMGGLVLRSACHAAVGRHDVWPTLVRSTVCLGTPHTGAPLERAAHEATLALRRVPEARPVATVLATRSVGIKDLGHGAIVDAEWEGFDPDERRAFERAEVPLLEGARHHVVAATLTRDRDHPVGRMLGDLFVLTGSAHGLERRRRAIAFEEDQCRHVGGLDHFSLLNAPELDGLLREWLA